MPDLINKGINVFSEWWHFVQGRGVKGEGGKGLSMCWKSGLSNTLLLLTIENANCYDDFQYDYPANIIVEF